MATMEVMANDEHVGIGFIVQLSRVRINPKLYARPKPMATVNQLTLPKHDFLKLAIFGNISLEGLIFARFHRRKQLRKWVNSIPLW
jgi:hypothetical protein